MGWHPLYAHPWGGFPGIVSLINRSLEKRLTWITQCASVNSFYLITHDNFKTNKWGIFVEVISIREYYILYGHPAYRPRSLEPHSCYYLGQYPWHWYYQMGCPMPPVMGTAHEPATKEIKELIAAQKGEPWTGPNLGPYEGTTGGTDISPELLENYDKEDFIFYHGKRKYGNYLAQQQFDNNLKTRLKKCIQSRYPPTTWIPERKVKTPQGIAEWPGKPIKEMDTPTPTAPKGRYPKRVIHMGLAFSPINREDGLTLSLEIL